MKMELLVCLLGILRFCQASVTDISGFRGFSKEIMNDSAIMVYPIIHESPLNFTIFECAIFMKKIKSDEAPVGTSQEDDRCEVRKFPPLLLKPEYGGPYSAKILFIDKNPYIIEKTLWEKIRFVLFLDESKKFSKNDYFSFDKGTELGAGDLNIDQMVFTDKSPFPGPYGTLAWNVGASIHKTIEVQSADTDKYTVIFWYKIDLEPTEPHLIMKNDLIEFYATGPTGGSSQNHPICKFKTEFVDGQPSTNLPIQSWAHIAITGKWNDSSSAPMIKYYLNGDKTGEGISTESDGNIGTSSFIIGDASAKGHLSSLMFFAEALEKEDIVELMNLKTF